MPKKVLMPSIVFLSIPSGDEFIAKRIITLIMMRSNSNTGIMCLM